MNESDKLLEKEEEKEMKTVAPYLAPCLQPIILTENPFKKSREEIEAGKAKTRENARKLKVTKTWK